MKTITYAALMMELTTCYAIAVEFGNGHGKKELAFPDFPFHDEDEEALQDITWFFESEEGEKIYFNLDENAEFETDGPDITLTDINGNSWKVALLQCVLFEK